MKNWIGANIGEKMLSLIDEFLESFAVNDDQVDQIVDDILKAFS